MKPVDFSVLSKNSQSLLPVRRAFSILFALVFMAGCGSNNSTEDALDAYRIQIGAKEFDFKQQMLYVQLSLEIYRMHVGAYPSESNHLESLVSQPQILEGTGVWRGPYAVTHSIFYDPWGRKLQYKLDEAGKVDLRCLGVDGVPSEDDICAKDLFPDIYRELEKLPQMGPIPIPAASH